MSLPEEIMKSVQEVGATETASIMARALCYLAKSVDSDVEFDCDIGTVNIITKDIKHND